MGCQPSQLKPKIEPEPQQPRKTDLPLSARQLYSLKRSWKGIQRELEVTATDMFVRLFWQHPCLKSLFTFKNMENVDECKSSAGRPFTHHAFLVMKVVDVCISNIDDFDYMSKVFAEILRIHKGHSISYKLFWKIKQPFLQAVKHTLDDRYTDNMETIYITVIDYILLHLSEGISESECLDDEAIKEEIERSGIVSLNEELAKKQSPKSSVGLKYDSSTLTELVSQKTEDEPENDKLQEFGVM